MLTKEQIDKMRMLELRLDQRKNFQELCDQAEAAIELREAIVTIWNDWQNVPESSPVPDEINWDDHWESVKVALAKCT